MKKFLLASALACLPALAHAADPAPAAVPAPLESHSAPAAAEMVDADPALWVVRDEDTTIFLFGTFHLLDGRPWFNDEVKQAFDQSGELVLEAILPENPADIQPLILRYAVDPQGRKLSDRLSPEQNRALGQALSTLGAPAAAFDPLEPWFVSMTLAGVAGQKMGIHAEHGPETVLSKAARERGIEVAELEGLEWQIQLFDNMPEEQQIAQLRQALDNLESLPGMLAPMLEAWSTGDVDGLHRIVETQSGEDPELHRLLFTERNRNWAGWVQERLERPGIVFLAVGAGHLTGNDSVQAVLAARGINSERVPPATPVAASAAATR